jgi:hypothetical protein
MPSHNYVIDISYPTSSQQLLEKETSDINTLRNFLTK